MIPEWEPQCSSLQKNPGIFLVRPRVSVRARLNLRLPCLCLWVLDFIVTDLLRGATCFEQNRPLPVLLDFDRSFRGTALVSIASGSHGGRRGRGD
jgi:hypothetical protein